MTQKDQKNNIMKIIGIISICFVAFVLVATFFVIGSPKSARMERFDEHKIRDLQTIYNQINFYYQDQDNKSLPNSLSSLKKYDSEQSYLLDPETKEEYIYEIVDNEKGLYRLCANFHTNNFSENAAIPVVIEVDWRHKSGQHCYNLSVSDNKPYPIRPF